MQKPAAQPALKNLIICPIGDTSVHSTWIAGPSRPNFDLFLIYYGNGPDQAAGVAQHYLRRKGFKFELLHHIVHDHAATLSQYEQFWCPDDDIALETNEINSMFEIFARYRLQLAQPSVAKGDISYRGLLQRSGNILRYTPFVEVMCPLLTREALAKIQDTFLESRSAWGLDWIWSKRFSPLEMAVIDKVGVHHTRPLCSGEHYKSLARLGINPIRDFEKTAAHHGGIDLKLVERMRRGQVRMKRVPDLADRRSIFGRFSDHLQWRLRKRSSA